MPEIIERIRQVAVPATVFLATVTISLTFAISAVASKCGPQVTERFLERGVMYDAQSLKSWVSSNPSPARHYAFPVLFPLDLLFMIFFGGFLALGSVACASNLDMLKSFAWFFALFPSLYVAADLIEDTLLALMLLTNGFINDKTVFIAKSATSAKLLFVTIAIGQTIVLSASTFIQARD